MTVRARALTTDPESTSRKFLLIAGSVRSSDQKNAQIFQLDFSNIFSRQCQLDRNNDANSDFEKWYARDLTEGADCLMGHEQIFYRRKVDRDCYVGREFQDPEVEVKNCPCTRADYECDYNFARDKNGDCVRIGPDRIFANQCTSKDDYYAASSGYRLISGNTCIPPSQGRLDYPVDRKCSENIAGIVPSPEDQNIAEGEKEISRYQITFNSEIEQFLYFRDSEAILVRLQVGELWRSGNQGVDWTRVLENEGIIHNVILHEFDNNRAYAILQDGIYFTEDQGQTWHPIKVPAPPSERVPQTLDFHPVQKDWLLFIGKSNEPVPHNEAYISRNHGRDWTALDLYVEKCIFGRDANFKIDEDVIFCSAYNKNDVDAGLRLVRTRYLAETTDVYFENLVEFFVVEDFMAVASSHKGGLALYVSIDGTEFSEAKFPPDEYVNRMVS